MRSWQVRNTALLVNDSRAWAESQQPYRCMLSAFGIGCRSHCDGASETRGETAREKACVFADVADHGDGDGDDQVGTHVEVMLPNACTLRVSTTFASHLDADGENPYPWERHSSPWI